MRTFSRMAQPKRKFIILLTGLIFTLVFNFIYLSIAIGSRSQLNSLTLAETGPIAQGGPTLVVGKADDSVLAVVAGRTITVPISIQNIPSGIKIGTITARIKYNNSLLKPISCLEEINRTNYIEICNLNLPHDTIWINGTYVQGLPIARNLSVITFETRGSGGSSTVLAVEVTKLTDANGNNLKFSSQDQEVRLVKLGDVNCDGENNLSDVIDTLKHLVELLERSDQCPPLLGTLYWPACDTNGDDLCGLSDAIDALKCLVRIPVEDVCPAEGFIFSNPASLGEQDGAEENDAGGSSAEQNDNVAGQTDATLRLEMPKIQAGSTFTVTVIVDTEVTLAASQVSVNYNTTQFRVVDCQVVQKIGMCNPDYRADTVLFNTASQSGASGLLYLANISFEHIGERVKISTFRIVDPIFATSQEEPIAVTVEHYTLRGYWLYLPIVKK